MAKICPNCKTSNADNAEFCQNCGQELGITSSGKTNRSQNTGGVGGWWNKQGTGAKAAIGIVGICCIGLILIVAFAGMFSSDQTTTTTPTTNTTVSTPTTTTSDSNSSTTASGIQVRVNYSGSWTGNYGDESGSQSVEGSGTKTFTISGSPSVVSAVFQKYDGGSGTLTVEILENGVVVESRSTSAEYGVVSLGYSV